MFDDVSSCLDLTSPFLYGTMVKPFGKSCPYIGFSYLVGKFFKNISSVCAPTHTVNRRLLNARSAQGESRVWCHNTIPCRDPFHA
jgi:hypothetical protein